MNSLVLLAGLAPGVARFIIEENHVKSIRRTINRIPWVVINQHVCSHSGCHLGLADARSVLCKVIAKINLRDNSTITRKMIAYASQLHHYHLNKDVQMFVLLTAVPFCNN